MIAGLPPPPEWLDDWARSFLVHAAPWFYWLLAAGHLIWWTILRWQKRPNETPAARGLRRFMASKVVFWLALAVGRSLFGPWMMVGYAAAVCCVLAFVVVGIWGTVRTYAGPIFRDDPPPIDGTALPEAEGWNGDERRVKERRKDWPPKIGA